MKKITTLLLVFGFLTARSQTDTNYVKDNYTKIDTVIVMRDGIKLYTTIYTPKDQSKKYPILMERTPYSSWP